MQHAADGMREAMMTLQRQAGGSRALARGVLAAALESEAFLTEASSVVERTTSRATARGTYSREGVGLGRGCTLLR